jgi:glutamine synthetase
LRLPIAATTRDGRNVSPPTVEFRLPDGSAHPHLLLAGIAQAMRLGRATPDAGALIDRTSAAAVAARPDAATNVPRSFEDVADALARHAAALEEDGVFPGALLQQMVVRLRG